MDCVDVTQLPSVPFVDRSVSEVLVCYSLGVYESQSNPQRNRVTR